jgi:tripartite-type tricarboxylate transporter receptor subunit TctC
MGTITTSAFVASVVRSARLVIATIGALILSVACMPAARAQNYPAQPVKIIVQQGPGGSLDIALRILGESLSPILGQQVVVMNQPGAGGLIAARALASSAPDGYTLFMAASSVFVSLPELQSNLSFDVNDFVPIGYIGEQPFALGVASSLPVNSVDEFIAYSKKYPEGLNTVAGTQGGLQHMSLEWFRARSGANLTMVHYPSTAAAINDVISGRVPVIWDAVTSLSGPVAAGGIKLLAVTSAKRLATLPQIPPIADSIPGFAASGWLALVGPKGLPNEIAQKLNTDLRTALVRPELQKKYEELGTFTRQMSLQELADFVRTERGMWRPIVRQIQNSKR